MSKRSASEAELLDSRDSSLKNAPKRLGPGDLADEDYQNDLLTESDLDLSDLSKKADGGQEAGELEFPGCREGPDIRQQILEYVLFEPKNYILVQKVGGQTMSLRFSKSKADPESSWPARRIQHPEILYTCKKLHREGWEAALKMNHFSFASLTVLAEFLDEIGKSHRESLTSIDVPLLREDDVIRGMEPVNTFLKDCINLRYVEILAHCSRVHCPAASNVNAADYVNDRDLWQLPVCDQIRKLPALTRADLNIDVCLLETHGPAMGAPEHSHHNTLVVYTEQWLNDPAATPPDAAEILGTPVEVHRQRLRTLLP